MVPICKISFRFLKTAEMYSNWSNSPSQFNNFDNPSVFLLSFYFQSLIDDGTGLATKDETSETIVRNLFSPFFCIRGLLQAKTGLFVCLIIQLTINLLNCLVKPIKLQIVIYLEFWIVFTVSSFVGNPVSQQSKNKNFTSFAS